MLIVCLSTAKMPHKPTCWLARTCKELSLTSRAGCSGCSAAPPTPCVPVAFHLLSATAKLLQHCSLLYMAEVPCFEGAEKMKRMYKHQNTFAHHES